MRRYYAVDLYVFIVIATERIVTYNRSTMATEEMFRLDEDQNSIEKLMELISGTDASARAFGMKLLQTIGLSNPEMKKPGVSMKVTENVLTLLESGEISDQEHIESLRLLLDLLKNLTDEEVSAVFDRTFPLFLAMLPEEVDEESSAGKRYNWKQLESMLFIVHYLAHRNPEPAARLLGLDTFYTGQPGELEAQKEILESMKKRYELVITTGEAVAEQMKLAGKKLDAQSRVLMAEADLSRVTALERGEEVSEEPAPELVDLRKKKEATRSAVDITTKVLTMTRMLCGSDTRKATSDIRKCPKPSWKNNFIMPRANNEKKKVPAAKKDGKDVKRVPEAATKKRRGRRGYREKQ